MGWPREIFLSQDADLEMLTCTICQDVFQDPQAVGCPGDHMFCSECLSGAYAANARVMTCPLCRSVVATSSIRPGQFVKRLVDRLRVKCGVDLEGTCTWTGLLGDDHNESCAHRPIVCPDGCGWKGQYAEIEEHSSACPLKLVVCPREGCVVYNLFRADLESHEACCSAFRCSYSSVDGCTFMDVKDVVARHEEYCSRLHLRLETSEATRQALEAKLLDKEMEIRKLRQEPGLVRVSSAPESSPKPSTIAPPPTIQQWPYTVRPSSPILSSSTPIISDTKVDLAQAPAQSPAPLSSSREPDLAKVLFSDDEEEMQSISDSGRDASSSPDPLDLPFTLTAPARRTIVRKASGGDVSTSTDVQVLSVSSPASNSSARLNRPFILTTSSSNSSLPPPPPAPRIPTRAPDPHKSDSPFNLTSRTERPVITRRPRSAGSMPSSWPTQEERNSSEEVEGGVWEKNYAKRPRFDGGFPEEWKERQEA